MKLQGDTRGDHYNCACPFCGRFNNYIAQGVVLCLNEIMVISKRCFYCEEPIFYQLEYEIKVTASREHPHERMSHKGVSLDDSKKPKAIMVKVHDDGFCSNSGRETPLDEKGDCPVCNIHPDTQSTAFVFQCPVHRINLRNSQCPVCGKEFDASLD